MLHKIPGFNSQVPFHTITHVGQNTWLVKNRGLLNNYYNHFKSSVCGFTYETKKPSDYSDLGVYRVA